MQRYWFDEGKCEAKSSERIIPPDWEDAKKCGIVCDRQDYIAKLHELCVKFAEEKVQEAYSLPDAELRQLVRMLDEMDESINQLTGHLTEWYRLRDFCSDSVATSMSQRKLVSYICKNQEGSMAEIAGGIESLWAVRKDLADEISVIAGQVLPNSSALVGPLVAARLVSAAGGLERFARLPAASIQVLGAKTALFSHIRNHTPPPKHGIIFQHKRVHAAPRKIRGRVARVIAGKLAIAGRIDHFRGSLDEDFISMAQIQVNQAGHKS